MLTEAWAVEIAKGCGFRGGQTYDHKLCWYAPDTYEEALEADELLAWFKSPDGMAWGLRWLAEKDIGYELRWAWKTPKDRTPINEMAIENAEGVICEADAIVSDTPEEAVALAVLAVVRQTEKPPGLS